MDTFKTYFYRRRKCLAKTGGVVGGVYLAGKYISARLDEVKARVMEERIARENLRRRFHQTQEDISYTVMALIPALAEQIVQEMNVESVTAELQALSSAPKSPLPTTRPEPRFIPPNPNPPLSSSLTSSTNPEHDNHDTQSDAGSLSHSVATSGLSEEAPSLLEYSSQSWVENVSSTDPSANSYAAEHASSSSLAFPSPSISAPLLPDSGTPLSASIMSTNSSMLSYPEVPITTRRDESPSTSSSLTSNSRTKSELWNEIKILSFTRAMTIVYSTTLLSLFATLQLTILARSKYTQSVIELSRAERDSERMSALALATLITAFEDTFASEDDEPTMRGIDEEVERQYLTLSWWITHVGWKDVGERVRKAVEDALDGVSLKSKLGLVDIRRLVMDIRRRVEHEITFEGKERSITFLSMLLPPTPEMTQHALIQAGYFPVQTVDPYDVDFPSLYLPSSSSHSPPSQLRDPQFLELIEETRRTIASADFERVVDVCMERSVQILFEDLENDLFHSQQPDGSSSSLREEPRIRLASLLPVLTRWSRDILNGLPNALVDVVIGTREVSALSAIVFSRFEELFL